MFKVIGIGVLIYTAVCVGRGEVFAKSGVWGKIVSREESPGYFWSVIAIYAVLGILLIVWF